MAVITFSRWDENLSTLVKWTTWSQQLAWHDVMLPIEFLGLYSMSGKTSYRRSREVSKPRDSGLDFSNRSEIWQAAETAAEMPV